MADPDVDRTRLVGHRLDDLGGDFNSSGLQGFSELDGRPFPLLFLSFIDLNLHAEDNHFAVGLVEHKRRGHIPVPA